MEVCLNKLCGNGEYLINGRQFLFNNLWGSDNVPGSQCSSFLSENTSSSSWMTKWDWKGDPGTIKSYAAMVRGWHWGWKIDDPKLPLILKDISAVHSSWKFDFVAEEAGGVNVTYDLWFSKDRSIENKNPDAEIMVWLFKAGDIRPIGKMITTYSICESEWELWSGPHPHNGWPVHSFVRTENCTEADVDLALFIKKAFEVPDIETMFLLSIQAGIEVFTGKGRLVTQRYSLDIESALEDKE